MLLQSAGRKQMSNEFDAFSAGVEPGGLRNTTQIKILITFIVANINEPLGADTLVEALGVHGLANYFEITQAMEELESNGNIATKDGFVYITPKGTLSLGELSAEIPRSVKETALADAMKLLIRAKRESENTVEITEAGSGYHVTFKVTHKGDILMKLTVYAADLEQAQSLKSNFINDPSHVYATVVSSLFV